MIKVSRITQKNIFLTLLKRRFPPHIYRFTEIKMKSRYVRLGIYSLIILFTL